MRFSQRQKYGGVSVHMFLRDGIWIFYWSTSHTKLHLKLGTTETGKMFVAYRGDRVLLWVTDDTSQKYYDMLWYVYEVLKKL